MLSFKIYTFRLSFLLFVFNIRELHGQGSSISFIPNEPLCIGEEVIMVCFVQAPTSENFGLNTATISINGSTPGLHAAINDNTILEVDTSRYTADTAGLTTSQSRPGARLVISNYLPSDSDTTFQCSGQYPNATTFSPIPPESPMPQAPPPSAPPNVTVSTINCTYTFISWTAPASDRAIEIYYVYRNSTLLAVTTGTLYIDRDQLLVNTLYQYSVIANSCAGNSTEGIGNSIIEVHINTGPVISYSPVTSIVDISWTLDCDTQDAPVDLTYSLMLMYNHTQANTTFNYTELNSKTQTSTDTTIEYNITSHNFAADLPVVTNITVCIQIVNPYPGIVLCEFYSTEDPVVTTAITTNTTPTGSTGITAVSAMPTVASNQVAIIGAVIVGVAVIPCCFCFIAVVVITIVIIYFQKKGQGTSKSRGNLENIEGDGKETKTGGIQIGGIRAQGYPPQKELLYADLDLVASHTGTVNQTVEETHYMRVKPTYDGPNK